MKIGFFRKWRRKRRKKKALKKIQSSVYAFIYMDKALRLSGCPKWKRKQFKRDLICSENPELVLLRFLREIKKI